MESRPKDHPLLDEYNRLQTWHGSEILRAEVEGKLSLGPEWSQELYAVVFNEDKTARRATIISLMSFFRCLRQQGKSNFSSIQEEILKKIVALSKADSYQKYLLYMKEDSISGSIKLFYSSFAYHQDVALPQHLKGRLSCLANLLSSKDYDVKMKAYEEIHSAFYQLLFNNENLDIDDSVYLFETARNFFNAFNIVLVPPPIKDDDLLNYYNQIKKINIKSVHEKIISDTFYGYENVKVLTAFFVYFRDHPNEKIKLSLLKAINQAVTIEPIAKYKQNMYNFMLFLSTANPANISKIVIVRIYHCLYNHVFVYCEKDTFEREFKKAKDYFLLQYGLNLDMEDYKDTIERKLRQDQASANRKKEKGKKREQHTKLLNACHAHSLEADRNTQNWIKLIEQKVEWILDIYKSVPLTVSEQDFVKTLFTMDYDVFFFKNIFKDEFNFLYISDTKLVNRGRSSFFYSPYAEKERDTFVKLFMQHLQCKESELPPYKTSALTYIREFTEAVKNAGEADPNIQKWLAYLSQTPEINPVVQLGLNPSKFDCRYKEPISAEIMLTALSKLTFDDYLEPCANQSFQFKMNFINQAAITRSERVGGFEKCYAMVALADDIFANLSFSNPKSFQLVI